MPLNPPFQAKLKLAASLDEISAAFAASKSSKASAAATELLDKAPGAVVKLKAKGGEVQCLTVAEIFAVALRYFNTALKKGLKPAAVLQLRKLIETRPNVIGFSLVAAAAPTPAPVTASPPAVGALAALEAAADSEDEEEGGDGWGGEEEEEEEEEGELSDEEGEEDMEGEGSEEETKAELGGGTRTKRPRG